ncbi:hypothetical protein ACFLUH_03910, partial [Chloroflexota bacterium]
MKSRMKGAIGVGLAVVLALTLALAAIPAADAEAGPPLKWNKTDIPTVMPDRQIIFGSDLRDMAANGDTVYVVGYDNTNMCDVSPCPPAGECEPRVWKTNDGGKSWLDLTAKVQTAKNLPYGFKEFCHVAVAPDDPDWLAVAGYSSEPMVVVSKDGGSNFTYAGEMMDPAAGVSGSWFIDFDDLAISPLVQGTVHMIAAAGQIQDDDSSNYYGGVYRLDAGTWLTAGWVDTTDNAGGPSNGWMPLPDGDVTSVVFSPNFGMDRAVVTLGNDGSTYFQQSGTWEPGPAMWNTLAGFTPPVEIRDTGNAIELCNGCCFGEDFGDTGISLPSDYDGTLPPKTVTLVFVNGYNPTIEADGGWIFRIDMGTVSPRTNPSNNPFLYSMAYSGTVDSGKAIVGTRNTPGQFCYDVQVYRSADLDICCPKWYAACKPPTGWCDSGFPCDDPDGECGGWPVVTFTADGEKAYAITHGDESAFSVSMDDGRSWNQWGLIDTYIDYIDDFQVTGDCNKAYITTYDYDISVCDSVWRSEIDEDGEVIGDFWERVFTLDYYNEWGVLRLPVDEIHPSAVYLGVTGSTDMWYSLDQGQCWTKTPAVPIDIWDFAVETEDTVYVLDVDGFVTMSDAYGRHWTKPVNTKVGSGESIAVMEEGMVLVGGNDGGKVAWSDDGAATFSLTPPLPGQTGNDVHVAWAPLCPDTIFAVTHNWGVGGGGIFRYVFGDPGWKNLGANAYDYTGIVLGKSDGTLYASYYEDYGNGVARNLDPCETACCDDENWSYLTAGTADMCGDFWNDPNTLRICGCWTADSDSTLWVMDDCDYYMCDGLAGTLWQYVDCVAKRGPDLVSPEDGAILACDPCDCHSAPFTLEWERLCNACSYDIFIFDEGHNLIRTFLEIEPPPGQGASPNWYIGAATIKDGLDKVQPGWLDQCGATYYWMVRVADAETGELIKSPWSEQWSFTIEAGMTGAISLVAPKHDATDV